LGFGLFAFLSFLHWLNDLLNSLFIFFTLLSLLIGSRDGLIVLFGNRLVLLRGWGGCSLVVLDLSYGCIVIRFTASLY